MGRVTKPLTALEVKKAKPSESVYDGGGLMLQVSPKGKKTWKFRFRENDKVSVISLGHFPDFSLEDARKKSAELRVKVSNVYRSQGKKSIFLRISPGNGTNMNPIIGLRSIRPECCAASKYIFSHSSVVRISAN